MDAPDETRDPAPAPPDDADARVERLLDADSAPEELAVHVAEQAAADAADTIERLERDEQAELVHHMEAQAAADALAHMELPLAVTVLLDLEEVEAAELIGLMDPDDAADLLQAIDKPTRAGVLKRLHPRSAARLGKLVLYDPETAGGIMTTDIAVVRSGLRIGQAIDFLKKHPLHPAQNEIYCVDDQKRLVGAVPLRDLLAVDDAEPVEPHMQTELDAVGPELDREDVARIFERYDLLTLPVVDEQRRVLGMITIDDVVDIIQAEATEDALKQIGAGSDEAVYSPLSKKMKGRFPWLLGNLLLAQAGAVVLLLYTDLIAAIPIVAVVYPIIANQSGNAGHQSMAVTLRGLVLGEVRAERVVPLLLRETLFGVIAGFLTGAVFGLAVVVIGPAMPGEQVHWFWLAVVAGLAMMGALTVGCLVGACVPMGLRRAGLDPATASSILVTMATDAASYATFLTLVMLMKDLLVVA